MGFEEDTNIKAPKYHSQLLLNLKCFLSIILTSNLFFQHHSILLPVLQISKLRKTHNHHTLGQSSPQNEYHYQSHRHLATATE